MDAAHFKPSHEEEEVEDTEDGNEEINHRFIRTPWHFNKLGSQKFATKVTVNCNDHHLQFTHIHSCITTESDCMTHKLCMWVCVCV